MNSGAAPGAIYLGDDRCCFTVWAPFVKEAALRLLGSPDRTVPLTRGDRGYHSALVSGVPVGTRYVYVLDSAVERPDPASRFQPEGVHGPSQVCASTFEWTDGSWHGIPLRDYIIYELHVGAFTTEGTFDAVILRLPELKALGVTAVELMPVAQFPGERNWGYDGCYMYAAQNTYGGPEALKKLVDACHREGLATILDVVYNHFGPEGNYAGEFGPYFTDKYHTPWGRAINYDGPGSDEVRDYFVGNALYWLKECHFDALRLDALHAILDMSAQPFLAELSAQVAQARVDTGRELYLIGESDLNDPRLIRTKECGGLGLDAQWSDDFHHSLHTLLTRETSGYYADFGEVQQMATAWHEGYAYSGQYSVYRQSRHGASAADLPPFQFVVCAQNHDQVGNRARGDRLSTCVSFERLKLAAACVALSPHVPLLFMGEEYGETAPFPYFVHHSDQTLIEAVRKGRREEFEAFRWQGDLPDPQDLTTFLSAKLDWTKRAGDNRRILLSWYRELFRLRREEPLLTEPGHVDEQAYVFEAQPAMLVRRSIKGRSLLVAFNFGDSCWDVELPPPIAHWDRQLDSSDLAWGGPGCSSRLTPESGGAETLRISPQSAVVLFTAGDQLHL